jgi:hypothetical protein
MPSLSYKLQGRFANNLIQYCIAKLLCKLFGHTLSKTSEKGAIVITDFEWKMLAPTLVQNIGNPSFFKKHLYAKKNLRLEGFFQHSEYLRPFRQTILSFFTLSNKDSINEIYTVDTVVKRIQDFPKFNEIVIHLRLDDFRHAGNNHTSIILHPDYFHRILPQLLQTHPLPIRIVYERKDHLAEEAYLQTFVRYKPMFQSSDLLNDFATLVNAQVLVSSNSTLSWIAAFLAKDQVRVLPTICHMGSQALGPIESTDIVKESFFIEL